MRVTEADIDRQVLAIFQRMRIDDEAVPLTSKNSRGDCPSFEPLIAAYIDAALSPTAETSVVMRVVKLSA